MQFNGSVQTHSTQAEKRMGGKKTSHVNPTPDGTRTMYCLSFGKGESFTHLHNKMYEKKSLGVKNM